MLNKIKSVKGASLLEFGILVSLIGAVSIASVSQFGSKVTSIFSDAAAGVAYTPPSADDLTFQSTGGAFHVTGTSHMTPAAGETRDIVVRNRMSEPTDPIVTMLVDGAHFNIISDSCDGVTLQPNETCTVTLEAHSDQNGDFEDALRVYY
jgi:Flp pilus assembly pilin Flp